MLVVVAVVRLLWEVTALIPEELQSVATVVRVIRLRP
jgi:hypothetical protein